jgi:hydroxyacylglutathione hydrolase
MKNILLITFFLSLFFTNEITATEEQELHIDTSSTLLTSLEKHKWIHGSPDCKTNKDPAIEVFQYDKSSYILRQNKCLSYEAPFIYVLVGDDKILVVDTGATESANEFPLYETVLSLKQDHADESQTKVREILVVHSHSHSDHYTGDAQFKNQPNVTVVATSNTGVNAFYDFKKWPNQQKTVDLGGRSITIIPTPGHQEEAIAIYDTQTQWLLTGDTFYPGIIYVKDWTDYKDSIERLASFVDTRSISAILGAHIEMTNTPNEYYEIGTIYQPKERSLVLTPEDLISLNAKMSQSNKARKISLDALIVEPLSTLPKLISNIARWFIQ